MAGQREGGPGAEGIVHDLHAGSQLLAHDGVGEVLVVPWIGRFDLYLFPGTG